jgi:hypothetical protein
MAAVIVWLIGSANVIAAPNATNGRDVTVISNLRYRAGPKDCTLDLALPKGHADRSRPAVIVIHGGGWIEGDKSSFVSIRTPGNIVDFATAGFVAAAVNYRLSREAPFPARFTRLPGRRSLAAGSRARLQRRLETHRRLWQFCRRPSCAFVGTARHFVRTQ